MADSESDKALASRRRYNRLMVVVIVVIGVFYLCTIRKGHSWGDDSLQYILQTRNLVEGRDFGDIGYIFNPGRPGYAPRSYPLGFSIFLVPTYLVFGPNMMAMKIQMVLLFVGFLWVLFITMRRKIGSHQSLLIIALIGLAPVYWSYKDMIMSEYLFMLLLYGALYLIDVGMEQGQNRRKCLLRGIAGGVLVYMVCATRSIGIAVPIGVIILVLIKRKRLNLAPVIAIAVFVVLMGLQSVLRNSEKVYFQVFNLSVSRIIANLWHYWKSLCELWKWHHNRLLDYGLMGAMTCLALWGYVKMWIRGVSIYETFIIPYLAIIIIWPYRAGIRFMLPLIPLLLYYMFLAIKDIKARRVAVTVYACLLIALGASYVRGYMKIDYGEFKRGVTNAETVEMLGFVRDKTPADSIFIFRKPRVIGHYTGKLASAFHEPPEEKGREAEYEEVFFKYAGDIGASYLISGPFKADREFLDPFIRRCAHRLEQVFENADFKVFRILKDGNSSSSDP